MSIWLQKSALIQPRKSLSKSADAHMHHPPPVISSALQSDERRTVECPHHQHLIFHVRAPVCVVTVLVIAWLHLDLVRELDALSLGHVRSHSRVPPVGCCPRAKRLDLGGAYLSMPDKACGTEGTEGSQSGARPNFGGFVFGCIEAKCCK